MQHVYCKHGIDSEEPMLTTPLP